MVQGSKVLKVELSNFGSYLGRAEGCFEIRDKTGKIERYPHFEKEIGEAVLKSGSYVSVDALIDLALWNIDTYLMTKRNRVVAVLRNLEDDSHVQTRLSQYEALSNKKGIAIAKQFLLSKLESQNKVLRKYGLKQLETESVIREIESFASEDLKIYRRRLTQIEAKCSRLYFKEVFKLFPEASDLRVGEHTRLMMA